MGPCGWGRIRKGKRETQGEESQVMTEAEIDDGTATPEHEGWWPAPEAGKDSTPSLGRNMALTAPLLQTSGLHGGEKIDFEFAMAALGNGSNTRLTLMTAAFQGQSRKKGTLTWDSLIKMSRLRFSTDVRVFHPKNNYNYRMTGRLPEGRKKQILHLPHSSEAFGCLFSPWTFQLFLKKFGSPEDQKLLVQKGKKLLFAFTIYELWLPMVTWPNGAFKDLLQMRLESLFFNVKRMMAYFAL